MYDAIVIGAGSGGLNIASFLNSIGLKILLIDKKDESIGGDCLNAGCVPSKALIHVARQMYAAKNIFKYGVTVTGQADSSKVLEHVHASIETIRTHENAEYFRKKGMDVVLGEATFSGKHEVIVNEVRYTGKKIIIATGGRPRMLSIPGLEHVEVFTNETIFSMKSLPKKLVVIGTGPIGLELGQAISMLGSEVTYIGSDARILPKEKEEYAEVLYTRMKKDGISFFFNQEVLFIDENKNIHTKNKKNKKEEVIPCDAILVAIGRDLSFESLLLDQAGVFVKDGKIIVNDYLETTNKDVYVCGDVAGGYQFTHAAELHASVILHNFFNPILKKRLSYDTFSWVTYTTPEVATFGLSEDVLAKREIAYEVLSTTFADDDRAIVDENTSGKSELYVEKGSGKILGGTMVAEHAGELVQELLLAMTLQAPIPKLFTKIYPYPTATRINKKIFGEYMKRKITKFSALLLRYLYRL